MSIETSGIPFEYAPANEALQGSICSLRRDKAGAVDLANLDLLRSVAVGLVLIGHITGAMKLRGFGDIGHLGVLLFFVHTALVLMLSMGRTGLAGCRLYISFMVRRAFRIYPLSVVIIVFFLAFHIPSAPWLGGFVWPRWSGILSNILLIQNITRDGSIDCVLWSLPFEVQMYAVLPILYCVLRRSRLRAGILIWLFGASISSLEYCFRSPQVSADFMLLRYFPCFLAGVLAWQLIDIKSRIFPGSYWVVVLIVTVVLYRLEDIFRVYGLNWFGALQGELRNDHRIWLPPFFDLVRDWMFSIALGLSIPFFGEIRHSWLKAITRRIAKYSYGVYVCHVPMLWFFFTKLRIGGIAAGVALTLLSTAVVSVVLYHCIEHPAIQFGKLLTRNWINRRVLV